MVGIRSRWTIRRAAIWATAFLATGVLGDDILVTDGFTNCDAGNPIQVQNVDIKYNNNLKTVEFNVAGTSAKKQKVMAVLSVTAYGQDVYTNKFNPCEEPNKVDALCPVPQGTFGANGSQAIPEAYANKIPAIAFQIPDIAAMATLQLQSVDDGSDIGCVQSSVTNGKTVGLPAVSYVAAGVAGAALVMGGVSAAGSAAAGASGAGGAGTISPSFGEVFGVFQGFAMNGMMSANLPQVYRSFSKNFAFSTGLIPWSNMQISIDNFRASTGGNLTNNNFEYLQNATLVFADGSTANASGATFKRGLDHWVSLALRDIDTSVNTSAPAETESALTGAENQFGEALKGVKAFANEVAVPDSNVFMTILLIVAIVIAVIIVGILLIKVVLEFWALFGSFPEKLSGFRKHYWGSIARTVTQLILLLYGIWVLYCLYQFTNGDSWAAQALAAVTLAIFTGVLAFFSWQIYSMAQKLKNAEGDASALYEDKKIWMKYSLFYESYKKSCWWLFIPAIVYMFAKGAVLAVGDGHAMGQTVAQMIVEALFLCVLLWARPYERKSGNVVNILIQVVRVLSVVCVFVFVEEMGISETTKDVTGVVMIAIQSALAGLLAILIAYNAIVACVKQNPHRQRRKEMEKLQRDMDTLTPLDARNSLLMEHSKTNDSSFSMAKINARGESKEPLTRVRRDSSPDRYDSAIPEPANPYGSLAAPYSRPLTPNAPMGGANSSHENLISSAAPVAGRQPTLPSVGGYGGGYGGGYRGPGGY
ncbi:TRP-domain-containing protein [Xylariomycetidae sp. FL0641]|nr:TRP-domain-containing protein [Xylariomycetidae sp. FL0641]